MIHLYKHVGYESQSSGSVVGALDGGGVPESARSHRVQNEIHLCHIYYVKVIELENASKFRDDKLYNDRYEEIVPLTEKF